MRARRCWELGSDSQPRGVKSCELESHVVEVGFEKGSRLTPWARFEFGRISG